MKRQVFSDGPFSIVPIRFEDRYDIMQWRNEQIYHLRQKAPLTKDDQDAYFENVVARLFDEEKPGQFLFSFLKEQECIGYGGLVHINWYDQTAEISFIMKTALQDRQFEDLWHIYLGLIKRLSFRELGLQKVFTYAFDIRPRLYTALTRSGFFLDARLKNHCRVNNEPKDVLIHAFLNPAGQLDYRTVEDSDKRLLFEWTNEPGVRANSINTDPIEWTDHINWVDQKLASSSTQFFIFESWGNPVGQLRIEHNETYWVINYSVDHNYRGLGIGRAMIERLLKDNKDKQFQAIVRKENLASVQVFTGLGFEKDLSAEPGHGLEAYIHYGEASAG